MKCGPQIGSVVLMLLVLLLAMPSSYGGKIYKWVIDGKTEYRDKPPQSDKGTVEEKKINPDQNVIKMIPVAIVDSEGGNKKGKPGSTTTASSRGSSGNTNKSSQAAGSGGTTIRTKNPNTTTTSHTTNHPNIVRKRANVKEGQPSTTPNYSTSPGGFTPGAAVTPGPGF